MRQALSHVKAVLIDLSGTIHVENSPIPGAHEAILKLRKSQLKLKFVTNTTKEDLTSLHQRLLNLNFDIRKDEIYTSLTATRSLIEKENLRPHLMLSETAKLDFHGIDCHDPNAVVMGLSPHHFNYEQLNTALQFLLSGAKLIAINKARYMKRSEDYALGTGAFVAALEFASDVEATVVGKPNKSFFIGAANSLGVRPEDCVLIGDDARDDVGGAIGAGMAGVLVKTGKYRDGDEAKIGHSSFSLASDLKQAADEILSTK